MGRVFNSLHWKVTTAFLLVALVPLGIVSLFAVRTADRVIEGIVGNQLQNVADDKQALLARWIAERRADLEVVAETETARAAKATVLAPYLQSVSDHYQVYRRFVIVDADGLARFDTDAASRRTWADAAWFQSAVRGQRFLSPVRVGPHGNESVFDISVPMVEGGSVVGAICATVSTAPILQSVLRVSLGETGECYLVDRDGTFLVHRDPQRILRDTIVGSGTFSTMGGTQQPGDPYTDYRGVSVLGATRAIAGTNWYLVVEQDEAEAYAPSYALRRRIYLVIALSVAGAIGISLLLARYVSAPVRRLSEAAQALAAGNFDHPAVHIGGRRRDEIGDLRTAFENMADQLRERQSMLQERVDRTRAELQETDLRLQHTLEAAARSERMAAMGRLASGVAHEIRTPLASLKLYLQSIQDEMTLSPELGEDFDVAMHQVKRIETTINLFLNFARPAEPVRAHIDVARLIDDAVMVVRPRAAHQDVVVDVRLDGELPPVVGDVRQIGEALVNLMANAIDEMPRGGRLSISASSETIEGRDPQRPWLRLDVSDTGPGIGQDELPKLFEPFYTTKASGSGLGLAIVRGTVQRHEGLIRINTIPGEGSTFSLLFPAASAQGVLA